MRDNLKSTYGDWCLVAGAAEGLGKAFSRSLAREGLNLILVDRQKDSLDTLAGQLRSEFGILVTGLHLDLATMDAVEIIMNSIKETNCRFIIYNAAYSRVQKFITHDARMLDRYLDVNMRTPLHLIHAFCKLHKGNRDQKKGIMLMSSLAGSWGTQLLAPYGGSKAFNLILAESLYHELKGDGFDVLACIAGATSTPGYLASLPHGNAKPGSAMPPEKVVEAGLKSLGQVPFVVPGFKNKFIFFLLTRILPRKASVRIMNRAVGKLYRAKL